MGGAGGNGGSCEDLATEDAVSTAAEELREAR